jgi:hypothetical protein
VSAHFEIPDWANGPDDSANGGYAAGCIAQACGLISGAIEVNLRLPPPLGAPLTASWSDTDELWHVTTGSDRALVATARRTSLRELAIPAGVSTVTPDAATAASTNFPYAAEHPFPRCLCCGTVRRDDVPSLDIHCGRMAHSELFADAWIPTIDLADPDEPTVASRAACFSALDCPSATPFAHPDRPAVLARFEVELDTQAAIAEPHALVAWELARDGRKLTSASALVASDGQILGRARALWIEVRPT